MFYSKIHGLFCGKVEEVFVMPKHIDQRIKKVDLIETGQMVLKRRFKNNWESFEMFADSFKSCVIVEKVFGTDGKYSYCCNCFSMGDRVPAGVKGKLCLHVVSLYLKDGTLEKPSSELASNVVPRARFPHN